MNEEETNDSLIIAEGQEYGFEITKAEDAEGYVIQSFSVIAKLFELDLVNIHDTPFDALEEIYDAVYRMDLTLFPYEPIVPIYSRIWRIRQAGFHITRGSYVDYANDSVFDWYIEADAANYVNRNGRGYVSPEEAMTHLEHAIDSLGIGRVSLFYTYYNGMEESKIESEVS